MIINNLLGKLFKEQTEKLNKLHRRTDSKGNFYVIDPILFDADRFMEAIKTEVLIEDIVKSVDDSEMDDFLNNEDVKEGMSNFYRTFNY